MTPCLAYQAAGSKKRLAPVLAMHFYVWLADMHVILKVKWTTDFQISDAHCTKGPFTVHLVILIGT